MTATAEIPIRRRVREAAQLRTEHRTSGEVTSVRETPSSKEAVQPVSPGPRRHGVLGIRGSVTKNMGDFNSVTCAIYAELPFEDGTVQGLRNFYPVLTREVDHLLAVELALSTDQEPPLHPDDAATS